MLGDLKRGPNLESYPHPDSPKCQNPNLTPNAKQPKALITLLRPTSHGCSNPMCQGVCRTHGLEEFRADSFG